MGHQGVEDELEDFTWFFTAEYPQVVRLLRLVLRDAGAAEDLAQEAFVRLHRRWAKISTYDSPEAWVRRVALNLAFSWRRREARRPVLERTTVVGQGSDAEASLDQLDLRRAVRALPQRQRALIALYHLEDRPIAEVADLLCMSPGAVKVGLHRARARLADQLSRQEMSS